MEKLFSGDVAYLNGLRFGDLLREIGRVRLDHVPKDPEEAFVARTEKFMRSLESEVDRRAKQGTLAQDARPLRTLGLLRTLLQLHSRRKGWRATLVSFLRGVIRFERDRAHGQPAALQEAA